MKPASNRYVIGADVGAQGMRTVLLDACGVVVASAYAAYDPHYPAPSWAEEDPADWESALTATVRQVIQEAGVKPTEVVALALGSQVDGLVCVGERGEVLRPAIIWLDRRATAQCNALEQYISPIDLFHLTGANLDSSHVAPKMLWVRDHDPAIFEASSALLLPGRDIPFRLTGKTGVDYSNGSSSMP